VSIYRLKVKLIEWTRRYAGPEIAGTVAAFSVAWYVNQASNSLAAAAIAGSIAETIGYYGYAGVREALFHFARHHHRPRLSRYLMTGWHTIRDMLIEFGPSELVDSLLLRPLFMYLFPLLLDNFALGIVLGKLAADVVFYAGAAIMYELKKKHLYPEIPQ
jgi:hypothetical protein